MRHRSFHYRTGKISVDLLVACWRRLVADPALARRQAQVSSPSRRAGAGWHCNDGFCHHYVATGGDRAAGLQDRLRGGLDYRLLRFIDDGEAPSPQEFWEEQGQTRVRWLPYSYWVVARYESELINVDAIGLRRTLSFVDDLSAPRVYSFGGSTAWGEGARDAYTIPSQVARLLADQGALAVITNYAQTGYVSAQDLILFQRQLALGNQPDLALFYQGFNDIYSAYLQGKAGLPLRESQRLDDSEAGRLLRQGQPLLRPLISSVSDVDWSLVAAGGNSPGEIADNWLGNRRLIRAAAKDYGVNVSLCLAAGALRQDRTVLL